MGSGYSFRHGIAVEGNRWIAGCEVLEQRAADLKIRWMLPAIKWENPRHLTCRSGVRDYGCAPMKQRRRTEEREGNEKAR